MESVLGEYSIALFNTYDLLYIDSGYNSGNYGISQIENRIYYYMTQNLDDIFERDNSPWGNITSERPIIRNFQTATASYGDSIRAQIAENIKSGRYSSYENEQIMSGITTATLGFLSMNNNFYDSWSSLIEIINAKPLPKKLNPVTKKEEEVLLQNPSDWVYVLSGSDILSNTGISFSEISCVELPFNRTMVNRGMDNTGEISDITHYDNIYLDEFLLEKMNSFFDNQRLRLSKCELEYILVGDVSDYLNFAKTVEMIESIRINDNYLLIMNNPSLISKAEEVASKLEVCTLDKSFIEPVAQSILYACVYLETLNDMQQILTGNRVPFTKESVKVTIGNVIDCTKVSSSFDEGQRYIQYLLQSINELDEKTFNIRIMSLMEMEVMRQIQNEFNLSWCVERIMVDLSSVGSISGEMNSKRIYGYY